MPRIVTLISLSEPMPPISHFDKLGLRPGKSVKELSVLTSSLIDFSSLKRKVVSSA